MRLVVSAPTRRPIVWKVTKIENTKPIGIQKLTLYQGFWSDHTDYIERDENGHIIGMYANYFSSTLEPVEVDKSPNIEYRANISASNYILKVGGSYKLLKVSIIDDSGINITDQFSNATFDWKCFVDDEDLTEHVIWLDQPEFNNKKIKFQNDKTYLGKTLHVKCNISSNIKNLTASCDFELSI